MKHNYYQLYGLTIQTKNIIPHLLPSVLKERIDLTIDFKIRKTTKIYGLGANLTKIYASPRLASNQIPYLTVSKQYESEAEFLIIRYTNGNEIAFFVSDKKGENLKVYYDPNIPISNIYTYLLGPVIGCILRLKNNLLLHASVVNINNQAVAFIGEKKAGKSTLIATFAALGYPILSDDIAVLFDKNGQYYVELGYPRMRLWKNTIEHLPNIEVDKLQTVLSRIEKYYLHLSIEHSDSWNFQKEALPLSQIYYLKPRNEENQIAIQDYKPLEGFLKLKQNIYAEYMLEGELKAKEFHVLGKIANEKKVKALDRLNDLSQLENICQFIIQDVAMTLVSTI